MIKALQLVFDPARTWETIEKHRRGWWFVLLIHLLPLLAITGLAEGYGMITWGKWVAELGRNDPMQPERAWIYVGIQSGGSVVLVFVLAWIVRVFNQSVHGIATYRECFTLVAYALSPFFAIRLLDLLPGLTGGYYDWVSYVIGCGLILTTFYGGVPRMLRLTPGSAFGQYITGVIISFLLLGLLRFCAVTYRTGNLQF